MHRVVYNQVRKDCVRFPYNYGHTKGGEIALSPGGVSVTVYLEKQYSSESLYSSDAYLFPDAVKKALLLYLLHYSKPLVPRSMSISIGEKNEIVSFSKTNPAPVYSLVTKSLKPSLFEGWKGKAQAETILNMTKSSYDSRMAALFALLCADSQEFETERYIYNWMAINGMYNYLYSDGNSSIVRVEPNKKGERKRPKEQEQLYRIIELYGQGKDTIDNKDKEHIAREVKSLICRTREEEFVDGIKNEDSSVYEAVKSQLIRKEAQKPYTLSPYAYVLFQLCYYVRCNIFHANTPIALFSYAEEAELKLLRVLNAIMSEFLNTNLHLWFDKDYIANTLRPAADGSAAPINPFFPTHTKEEETP